MQGNVKYLTSRYVCTLTDVKAQRNEHRHFFELFIRKPRLVSRLAVTRDGDREKLDPREDRVCLCRSVDIGQTGSSPEGIDETVCGVRVIRAFHSLQISTLYFKVSGLIQKRYLI